MTGLSRSISTRVSTSNGHLRHQTPANGRATWRGRARECYADDGSGYRKLVRQRNVYKRLEQIGPDFWYFPAGAKCWLTIPKRKEEEVTQFLPDNGLPWQVTQGKRYVGGFIGSEDALSAWIEPKVENWTFAIERLARAAVRYPQTAYTSLARSLQ
ncbi:hypothetical protein THAOC_01421 [Thalassiosira oceanica]|uniref:Uncharacterized protein n=1 Tax=Thalassiosira oceanica TaxID=159749 RepID=K0THB6_THAOC|nr:hypothetical protein THAOC_01421 [Thalassiosira oceanica]|eukprot:EJK76800.1 hypothetical protein THAOC_01421 [Thalassiosira oceanica]